MRIQTFYSSYMDDTLRVAPSKNGECVLWCSKDLRTEAQDNTKGWNIVDIEELGEIDRHNTMSYLAKGYNKRNERTYEKILLLNCAYKYGGLTINSGYTLLSYDILRNVCNYCMANYPKKTSVVNKYEIKTNNDKIFNYGFVINESYSSYLYAVLILMELLLGKKDEFNTDLCADNLLSYPYSVNNGMIKYLNILPYEIILPYDKDNKPYNPFLTALSYQNNDYFKSRKGFMSLLLGDGLSEYNDKKVIKQVTRQIGRYLGLSYYKLTNEDFK